MEFAQSFAGQPAMARFPLRLKIAVSIPGSARYKQKNRAQMFNPRP